MKKVAVIVGTRPEAIKMAPVYLALYKELGDSVQLISTGQHQELLWQSIRCVRYRAIGRS